MDTFPSTDFLKDRRGSAEISDDGSYIQVMGRFVLGPNNDVDSALMVERDGKHIVIVNDKYDEHEIAFKEKRKCITFLKGLKKKLEQREKARRRAKTGEEEKSESTIRRVEKEEQMTL